MTVEQTGIEGNLSVFNYYAKVLFDTGATHSFISTTNMKILGLEPDHLDASLVVHHWEHYNPRFSV